MNPLIYPFTEGVVVQTEQAVTILKSRYPFCRFQVIPNPVAIPAKVPPLAERKRVIVNVGMIGRLKNQEFLIKAFAATKADKEWELRFVGDGPDRPRLEAIVKAALPLLGIEIALGVRFLLEFASVWLIAGNFFIAPFVSADVGLYEFVKSFR